MVVGELWLKIKYTYKNEVSVRPIRPPAGKTREVPAPSLAPPRGRDQVPAPGGRLALPPPPAPRPSPLENRRGPQSASANPPTSGLPPAKSACAQAQGRKRGETRR